MKENKTMRKLGILEAAVLGAEIPMAVILSKWTGWDIVPVVIGFMLIGTPVLLTVSGMLRKNPSKQG